MSVQKFRTPDGTAMVILPEHEYDDLLDEIEGLRAKEVLQRLASGEEETLTAEETARALDMHPVRFWREKRNLSQKALAELAGMPQSGLSQIESGRRGMRASTALRLAQALGVRTTDLLDG